MHNRVLPPPLHCSHVHHVHLHDHTVSDWVCAGIPSHLSTKKTPGAAAAPGPKYGKTLPSATAGGLPHEQST